MPKWLENLFKKGRHSEHEQLKHAKQPENPKEELTDKTRQQVDTNKRVVEVNIGLDFGTRFTKVCYRDVLQNRSFVLGLKSLSDDCGYINSSLSLSHDGRVSMRNSDKGTDNACVVDYLKMRLLDRNECNLPPCHPKVEELGRIGIQALSAYFLKEVLYCAKSQIEEIVQSTYGNVSIGWSSNIGVPVEHFNDENLFIFKQVFSVAWEWSNESACEAEYIDQIIDQYGAMQKRIDQIQSDCHAQPEVVAGLHSLVRGQMIESGRYPYVFADVGGGTIDLVSFMMRKENGHYCADMYHGKVDAYGTCILAGTLPGQKHHEKEHALFDEDFIETTLPESTLVQMCHIRNMLVSVVKVGRDKRDDVFCRRRLSDSEKESFDPTKRFPDDKVRPIKVLLGGGGAQSTLYQDLFWSTYHKLPLNLDTL